jgi:prophage regulatory protein
MTSLLNEKPMISKAPTLLKCKEVQDTVTISRATIYRWIKEGNFPKPVRLGANMVRWKASDIEAWMMQKEVAA